MANKMKTCIEATFDSHEHPEMYEMISALEEYARENGLEHQFSVEIADLDEEMRIADLLRQSYLILGG